ncbi:gas vesicle protein GvpO [Streptomyces silvisoli]|uniref:Gas vesicle protein n=1 Tax=Streptomyces silvisoli TaxID=3034235 RepID=A0ABT5ZT68_9ACTN|nr:gas vesicle protein [Streptomyces silvisoli]MDF3293023.1 gas vesicle protein [Streptomyces silvisoli]
MPRAPARKRQPQRRPEEPEEPEEAERKTRQGRSEITGQDENERQDQDEKAGRHRPTVTARKAAQYAAGHVASLTGRQPEAVTSLERTDNGWRVGVEVVETHRIPDSTDILAVYRVEVDDDGGLVSYRRGERHYRGRAEE